LIAKEVREMSKSEITRVVLILAVVAIGPGAARGQGVVDVRHERHVIGGYVEPNTPGAPGVVADVRLAAAVTDAAAFDKDGSLNLNKAIYVRFFDANRKAKPKAILILIPELESGAGSLGIPAAEVVRYSGGSYEVWVVDRRSNLLEDVQPIVRGWKSQSPGIIMASLLEYMENPAGRGGFIANTPTSVSNFMTEWGLDVHLRDLKAVVEQARKTTRNVYMGGHSLGAVMTQMFAAYDFGDVAGYKLIKGMTLIESPLDPLGSTPISDEVYFNGRKGLPGLRELREEPTEYPPFFAEGYGIGFITSVFFQLYDIGAQLVMLDPEGTQLYQSGYMSGLVKYPATNAACLGIAMDDEFQFQPIARTTVGFLKVPPGKTVNDVATRTKNDPTGVNPNGIWEPKNPGPGQVLQWDNLQDLGTLGSDQLTGHEVNRLETVVRQLLPLIDDIGPNAGTAAVNTTEWYLPSRLRLDVKKVIDLGRTPLSAEVIAAQKERGGNPLTVTQNHRVNIPALFVRASHGGFIKSNSIVANYSVSTSISPKKLSFATLNDYAHADMLSSLERTASSLNGKSVNKNLPDLLVDFVGKNR
jgi:pimeloyl-ACP methyl ester carboxylesterase